MATIKFTAPGEPVPQGSMNVGRGGQVYHSKSGLLYRWRHDVNDYAQVAARNRVALPIDEPVIVEVDFFLPRPGRPKFDEPATKPDVDKLCRAILDALCPKKGLKILAEDSRVVRITGQKYYADPGAERAEITIQTRKETLVWFKVDDRLWSHPKWVAAPPAARALYISAGSWSGFYENDGVIPFGIVKQLGYTKANAEALVKCGLFEKKDDTYLIHDYLDYNPSKEELESERAGKAERMAEWRKKKKKNEQVTNRARSAACSTATEPTTNGASSEDVAELETDSEHLLPNPNPIVAKATNTPIAPKGAYSTEFLDFWVAFPSERKAANPQCAKKFAAAVKAGTPAEAIIQAAQRYRDDPNRTGKFTVSPLTWLNQERWNAGPLPPRDDGPRFTSSQLALAADMQAALNRTNPPPQPQIGENPWD